MLIVSLANLHLLPLIWPHESKVSEPVKCRELHYRGSFLCIILKFSLPLWHWDQPAEFVEKANSENGGYDNEIEYLQHWMFK